VVSSILISVFITRMASQIREREANLATARENAIRNEQLVAIGTLAAGTAHTLGTPLSTMAVLITELDKMDEEELQQAHIKEDISMLKQQVLRCKESLTQLINYYNKREQEQIELSLDEFVRDISDYIRNIHPAAAVSFHIESDASSNVSGEPSLRHAIINIIENGIKAADERVEVRFRVIGSTTPHVEIAINDDGPGIPRQVMEKMGEPFISTRKESMGLGIFLANATVQRLGGSIEMFNLKVGGALTLVRLPLMGNKLPANGNTA
jgi:two-component system sensor histidine kinase RegB